MKLRSLTIFIILTLPMMLIRTIGAQTTVIRNPEMTTGTTTRVSVASDGTQANEGSFYPSVSADGRHVAFYTNANTLVSDDTNDAGDVFIYDRQTGETSRVSIASDGTQGNGDAWGAASISEDGRYVAFNSLASNLVNGDTNGTYDIFVHDRQTGETSRVSVASDWAQSNDFSWGASISADGRYVAFESMATNLINDDTNGFSDIFVHDRQTGETSRVSVASGGTQSNGETYDSSISADGRYVAFESMATNLINDDTNGFSDIFVHDRQTGETSRVSVASGGTQGNSTSILPSISADGRYVAFVSWASNLISGDTNDDLDIFVHDRQTGETSRVSIASDGTEGNNGMDLYGYITDSPSISADGRYVAFHSWGDHLVSDDTNNTWDVFVHDRQTGETSRVSVASGGIQGNNQSHDSSISADGRYVAFLSEASNLVSGDTNNVIDVFIHDREDSVSFSLSGRITDANSNPIAGVTLSTNTGYGTITDANGDYTIADLSIGSHTLTPSKSGYTFSPASRIVAVPPNATSQNFTGSVAPPEEAWTLMFFLAADNDLDTALITEYQSVSHAGGNPNVNLVAFYDGPNSQAKYTVFDGQAVGSFWQGELNTGDPSTLEDFISWAKSNYPAQNYALIISDHGHALGGVASDVTSNDSLSPKEIRQALVASGPIDVLVMANCLMANLEIEFELRGVADYYVASQSISWLPRSHSRYGLSIGESTTPEELAVAVAESYYEDRKSFDPHYPSTVSVVKLDNVEDVAAKAGTLAAVIRQHWLTTGIIVWQITDASILQRFEENGDFQVTNGDRLADLYHFTQLLSSLPETDIQNAANDLLSSLDNFILYNRAWSGPFEYRGQSHTWYHPNAYGVTVALPRSPMSFYTSDWLDFAGDPHWIQSNPAAGAYEANSSSLEWSSLLVDLINEFNPYAPDTSKPPDPVAPLVFPSKVFLPVVQR